MREIVNLPRKYNIILFSLWAGCIISAIIFFSYKYYTWQGELAAFRAREIRGKIIGLQDLERGSYMVEIYDTITRAKASIDLPVATIIKEHGIRVGDFASKDANSEVMIIYQRQNGLYKKCCDLLVSNWFETMLFFYHAY